MEESSVGQIFAIFIIVILIVGIAYITARHLHNQAQLESSTVVEPADPRTLKAPTIPDQDEGVLYENLNKDEAEALLQQLLEQKKELEANQ